MMLNFRWKAKYQTAAQPSLPWSVATTESGNVDQSPHFGQRNATAAALDQFGTKLLLEQADAPSERGLRDSKPLRSAANGATLGDREERAEVCQIHV